jgi:hypothetical protein
MLINGSWSTSADRQVHTLKLGSIFLGTVKRVCLNGADVFGWVATLNGKLLHPHCDLDYGKGLVEFEIVAEMTNLSDAYRTLKARAPTGSDLYPDGAWGRWKARQKAG